MCGDIAGATGAIVAMKRQFYSWRKRDDVAVSLVMMRQFYSQYSDVDRSTCHLTSSTLNGVG